MFYNLKKYVDLLEKNKLENDLTDNERLLLLEYNALIEGQISFNRKNEYLGLIQAYLSSEVQSTIFRFNFLEMLEEDSLIAENLITDFKQLSKFSINPKLETESFLTFIDSLYNISMLFLEGEIVSTEFESSVKSLYAKYISSPDST